MTIVYSHGFGTLKTDGTLFSDISTALADENNILFDYNNVEQAQNVIRVRNLQEQVALLRDELKSCRGTVDIIAHSQGCIVAAMLEPEAVRNIFLIAPPVTIDVPKLLTHFGKNPKSDINLNGESRILRRDGSTVVVPPSYWKAFIGVDLIHLYEKLSLIANVYIYQALQDEVLGSTDFGAVLNKKVVSYGTDHNFTNESRQQLIQDIQKEIL